MTPLGTSRVKLKPIFHYSSLFSWNDHEPPAMQQIGSLTPRTADAYFGNTALTQTLIYRIHGQFLSVIRIWLVRCYKNYQSQGFCRDSGDSQYFDPIEFWQLTETCHVSLLNTWVFYYLSSILNKYNYNFHQVQSSAVWWTVLLLTLDLSHLPDLTLNFQLSKSTIYLVCTRRT